MTSIKKIIRLLIISTLTINCSFAQWSEDANNIWGTAGGKSIGIGTATPKAKLEVMGEIKGYTQLHVGENYDAINGRGITVDNGGSTSWELLTLRNNFGTHFKVDGNGNVGIGITQPLGKLDISLASSGGGRLIFGNNPNDNKIFIEGFNKDATGSASEVLITGMNASNLPKFSVLTDKAFLSGNLGIGIPNPQVQLEVDRTIRSTYSSEVGPSLELSNPSKTGAKDAAIWRIFNMSGGYGNSLQFWGYSNTENLGPKLIIKDDGNIGIGVLDPKNKLVVNGTITAKKIQVTQTGWADYVFDKDYTLMPVDSLSTYIKTHKHLPEMPTTKDVQDHGVDVGNNQALLLKKIEELTLYIIEQHKEIEALKKKIK